MENQNHTVTKTTMNYGLYMGLALVLTSVVFYVLGKPFSEGMFPFTIIIVGLIWGIRSFREESGEEGLSYSRALGFGTMISVFASLIYAFYTFVLYKIIDHGLLGKLLIFMEEYFVKAGTPQNQIDLMMNMYKKILTPLSLSIYFIFGLTLMGFLFSLIIAIFFRKEPSNPFHGVE